eukprot:TRINITY_DN9487_c2_g1_i1.p1 TRINITY_DN9487_c2_g1~~TRINITY_DN9487_c2_g1_i1.p1  ORF type:complete len:246 (+),score=37.95 TRINITY_DN9487_c2_g1_i1:42-779(+)
MLLSAVLPYGKELTIPARGDLSISDLKAEISLECNLPADSFVLSRNNEQLEEEKTVADYPLRNRDSVHVEMNRVETAAEFKELLKMITKGEEEDLCVEAIEALEDLLCGQVETKDVEVLIACVDHGYAHCAKALIESNISDVNGTVKWPWITLTPLRQAASRHHLEIAHLLLDNGADPDCGFPLHKAACAGDASMVNLLLSHGASVNLKDTYDRTPLSCAWSNGIIQHILKEHGAVASKKGGKKK